MKTILALTDFSENATCAAEAGLVLCKKLGADLLLFNTCIDYSTMASYPGGGWAIDECSERKTHAKLELQLLTERLEPLCDKMGTGDKNLAVHWQSDDGDLGLDVADIINHHSVELIVMGARSGSPDEALYGEDTNAVINDATRPVFIIPSKTNLEQVRKIMFATDFDEAGIAAIQYLVKLSKLFNYDLEIIHVTEPGKKGVNNDLKEAAFRLQIDRLNYKKLRYRAVEGKNVVNTLNNIINENGGEILAMLHHQHSFFIRVFAHSETKRALSNQKVPLLVFPSKMK